MAALSPELQGKLEELERELEVRWRELCPSLSQYPDLLRRIFSHVWLSCFHQGWVVCLV